MKALLSFHQLKLIDHHELISLNFRLLELMLRNDASVEFAIEGAAILGSLARGLVCSCLVKILSY